MDKVIVHAYRIMHVTREKRLIYINFVEETSLVLQKDRERTREIEKDRERSSEREKKRG